MKLPIYFYNGQQQGAISGIDRGLAYGDGLFETCRARKGEIPLWSLHKARLLNGASVLGLNIIEAQLEDLLKQAIDESDLKQCEQGIVKLIVSRSVGGRGYRFDTGAGVNYLIMVMPAQPLDSHPHWDAGLSVRVCEHRLGRQGKLAGLKHLNRLDQVVARAEWQDEYDDGLMLDYDSKIIESISGNLLFVGNNRLVTPCLDACGVKGVMRSFLQQHFLNVIEAPVSLHELNQFTEIIVTNAVIGALPVKQIVDCGRLIWNSQSTLTTRTLQHHLIQHFSHD